MATYTEMVDKVVDWTNRNSEVIDPAQAKDFINYAVDDAYRTLRIAPLEDTYTYPVQTNITQEAPRNTLGVPSDLIEPIQMRQLYTTEDADGNTIQDPARLDYIVYEAKNDIRSFYDEYLPQYERYNYTRERNNFIISPNMSNNSMFQLFYYRRLPEFDARYAVNAANNTAMLLYYNADRDQLKSAVMTAEGTKVFTNDPDLDGTIINVTTTNQNDYPGLSIGYYVGQLAPNWLRDKNEKLVLYGALREAAVYLSEDQQALKYNELFQQEVQELNAEDNRRMLRGGAAQRRFSGNGLI